MEFKRIAITLQMTDLGKYLIICSMLLFKDPETSSG
jgi:hypothetical protein